ncbi:MAG TPA: NAD kinase [Bacteroidales bacterium]|nr:NAD kinase [Bacteroidales bacterium]
MKIAIFGKTFSGEFKENLSLLFEKFREIQAEIIIYNKFYDFILENADIDLKTIKTFNRYSDIDKSIDLMISMGGDGTFLESITYIRSLGIPIIGINTGRLGFLANIARQEVVTAFEAILNKQFTLEQRSLIQLKSDQNLFGDFNCALNEVTVQKESNTMISVHVYLNGDLLNSYWTDGLIVSTPTGSTAYSLSVGGPIATPDCKNFIISPIASHNLTVRPVIVPSENEIKLRVEGRNKNFLITLDSRSIQVDKEIEFTIKQADFFINMIKLEYNSFSTTLRNKLMWGLDKRN